MGFLQKPIQNKLSALLGAEVTFDKLSVSLLGGSLEALGMSVAGAGEPWLTVRRLYAEISIARALKGEIVVKSMTIEKPSLSIVRRADGTMNLPWGSETKQSAQTPALAGETSATADEELAAAESVEARQWVLDVQDVSLVDGEAQFRQDSPNGGYRLLAAGVLAHLTHAAPGFQFTASIDSVGRRDRTIHLGPIKISGNISGADDLSKLATAVLEATADVGDQLHAAVHCDSIESLTSRAQVDGSIDLAIVAAMLPSGYGVPTPLAALAGNLRLHAQASYDRQKGIRVQELNIAGTNLSVPPA